MPVLYLPETRRETWVNKFDNITHITNDFPKFTTFTFS